MHTAAPKARKATSLVSIAGSDRGQPMDLTALWRGRGAPAVPESGRGDRGLGGSGTNRAGIDRAINAVPTDNRTRKGIGRTRGSRSSTVPHREQIGVAPLGGRSTIAGPQQQSGQRKRGITPQRSSDRRGATCTSHPLHQHVDAVACEDHKSCH